MAPTVYVVYGIGDSWQPPIIVGAYLTQRAANEWRKAANAEYGRTQGTIGAFKVIRLEPQR